MSSEDLNQDEMKKQMKNVGKFAKNMDFNKFMGALLEIKELLVSIRDNQEQVIPALCTIYDREKHNSKILEKQMKKQELDYEECPQPHIDMSYEK